MLAHLIALGILGSASPGVDLDDLKLHLRVDSTAEDSLIQAYWDAALAHIDGPAGWLGRSITVQTHTLRLDAFDCDPIFLPYPPLRSVTSVQYVDGNGAVQTVDAADYEIFDGKYLVTQFGKSWPAAAVRRGAVRIEYEAGYDALPAPIRAALFMMVADMFGQRSSVVTGKSVSAVPMSTTVEALLAPFRVWSL